jgi:hypothetical protein
MALQTVKVIPAGALWLIPSTKSQIPEPFRAQVEHFVAADGVHEICVGVIVESNHSYDGLGVVLRTRSDSLHPSHNVAIYSEVFDVERWREIRAEGLEIAIGVADVVPQPDG